MLSSPPLPLPSHIDGIKFVLSDVDDTITTAGALLADTFVSIYQLTENNILFIPITGGCAGWCDSFARLWPTAAVIGENGGFYLKKDDKQNINYHFWQTESERKENTEKLFKVAEKALKKVPQVTMAKDQHYRLVDIAIDYNQDVKGVSANQVCDILSTFHREGMNAKASSIHVNAWIGSYNKKEMAHRLLSTEYGLSDQEMKEQVLFIGDSSNDESMFEFFPKSIGVANIAEHLPQLQYKPKWVTSQPYGAGFQQMIAAII